MIKQIVMCITPSKLLCFLMSADTYAMAGMALQCVKNAGFHVHSATELNAALAKTKQKLLVSRGANGHIGNEFSTGLAVQVSIYFLLFAEFHIYFYCLKLSSRKTLNAEVQLCDAFQALLAMGSPETEYNAALEAMRTSARCHTYHNTMAISQVLPALQLKSYLTIKNMQCLFEDGMWLSYIATLWPSYVFSGVSTVTGFFFADTLVLEPKDAVVELPTEPKVNLKVEVVTSSRAPALYSVDVPKGSTLLEALILLKNKSVGFT